ncbi:MAG: hypothetical protein RBT76_03770 [candidate division Zixibacteria bacterium]|nr:hypothetical protein [candidate division Zixibacteria bacterium]
MNRTERIAALVVPAFPVALFLCDNPQYRARPVVVADGGEEASEIIAANDIALAGGIRSGQTVAQGRLRVDNLLSVPYDREREMVGSSRLMNRLQALTPFVEEECPGRYYLEVGGMMLLYRSEHRFARAVCDLLAGLGLPATVGVASNTSVATVAAAVAGGQEEPIVVVPDGTEQEFLRPLPITRLPISDDTIEKLRLLGIRTIGQVASFGSNELIGRFEADGMTLARLSHGVSDDLFAPEQPTEAIEADKSLLYPVETIPALLAEIEPLLDIVLRRLRTVSRGCACLEVELVCEDKQRQTVSLALESPGLSARPFLRQLKQALSSIRFGAGVIGIRVHVPNAVTVVGEQLDLSRLAGGRPRSKRQSVTLPPGVERAYCFRRQYSPLPEKMFVLAPYGDDTRRSPSVERTVSPAPFVPYAGRSPAGLRLFQPPQLVRVVSEGERPVRLTLNRRTYGVVRFDGPWRLSGNWWDSPFERQYYEVTLDDAQGGRSYLVFVQGSGEQSGEWFVQGAFD